MHKKNVITAGKPLKEATKALILLHGRGASAEDILSLATYLNVKEYALIAPQATGNTWYPYSFMMPPSQNEPWLSSALSLIKELVSDLNNNGIASENIYFAGFSQGACLTLEFVARNATKFGGVAAFTGGLIGEVIYGENYKGDFKNTPVFIGTSNPDPHIPVERVYATTNILKNMNAAVTEKIYNNMGHTINDDEIKNANAIIFNHAS
ncbi:MAG: dienelactone hydrolase family protein [Chitinophagaceae bacterium]|nr:dienelactone hydrolase family protein [Chitinophagaceae bacterium]